MPNIQQLGAAGGEQSEPPAYNYYYTNSHANFSVVPSAPKPWLLNKTGIYLWKASIRAYMVSQIDW